MADLGEAAAQRVLHVSSDAQRILESMNQWADSPRGSEQSSVSLRGLVDRLRESNDEKKRHLSDLQTEIDSMRPQPRLGGLSPPEAGMDRRSPSGGPDAGRLVPRLALPRRGGAGEEPDGGAVFP